MTDKEIKKTWQGIRCPYCGAFLIKGRCPVNKKDCGRPGKEPKSLLYDYGQGD